MRAVAVCLAGVVMPVAQHARPAIDAALPAQETLNYSVEWRLITAGKAQLSWGASSQPSRPGWESRLHMESTGLVSKLFKVNDDYLSYVRPDLCTSGTYLHALEGRRQRETRVIYDREKGKAHYVERDLVKNAVLSTRDIDVPPCVHDVIGGLYALRTMNLEPGQSTQIPLSDGKKSVMARVEAQQREQVKTPAGSFRTVRYEAFLFNNVLYSRSGRLNIWLTDDHRKVPVQIRARMQFTIGTITLQLEKEEPK
jgi:hypothetical protein